MPELSEVEYSRDATVAAIRDYYRFLTQMYLDESDIHEPPEGGWPNITLESMRGLGKTDEVILLLRYLPYIQDNMIEAAPSCVFADWHKRATDLSKGIAGDKIRLLTEKDFTEDVPPHVVSLTGGGVRNQVFLLDTKLGIIHFCESPEELKSECTSRERVFDDPSDYAPENELNWRCDSPAWAIADFFELLKDQFRKLAWIPTESQRVIDDIPHRHPLSDGMIPMLKDIYWEHGWPDLQTYRKRECLETMRKALKERYPHEAPAGD